MINLNELKTKYNNQNMKMDKSYYYIAIDVTNFDKENLKKVSKFLKVKVLKIERIKKETGKSKDWLITVDKIIDPVFRIQLGWIKWVKDYISNKMYKY